MDCAGLCHEDLYDEDHKFKRELMEATNMPVWDKYDPNYRGDYFDSPSNFIVRAIKSRSKRKKRLRDEWMRREDEKQKKRLFGPRVVLRNDGPPYGKPTEEQKRIMRESYKRMLLREYELFAMSCLEMLEKPGAEFGCWKGHPAEEERAFYTQQLEDIRVRKDPFYSWRGKGYPKPRDDIWFGQGAGFR